ncbi:hypothetical protein M8J77_025019 [Diaphorina citri]|nr:hypothetical protein M8J77_025019 [Diaphorina citri]
MTQPTTSTGRRYRNGESRMDPRYFRPTYRYVNDSDDETYDSQEHHNHSAESIFLPEDDDPDESINISMFPSLNPSRVKQVAPVELIIEEIPQGLELLKEVVWMFPVDVPPHQQHRRYQQHRRREVHSVCIGHVI